jgi:hypothetical protein
MNNKCNTCEFENSGKHLCKICGDDKIHYTIRKQINEEPQEPQEHQEPRANTEWYEVLVAEYKSIHIGDLEDDIINLIEYKKSWVNHSGLQMFDNHDWLSAVEVFEGGFRLKDNPHLIIINKFDTLNDMVFFQQNGYIEGTIGEAMDERLWSENGMNNGT